MQNMWGSPPCLWAPQHRTHGIGLWLELHPGSPSSIEAIGVQGGWNPGLDRWHWAIDRWHWVINRPLIPEAWERLLSAHPDRLYVHTIIQIIRHGARVGYTGPDQLILSPNLPSANDSVETLDKDLQEYWVDCFLPFGLRTSPFLFDLFAKGLHFLVEAAPYIQQNFSALG